MLNESHEMVTVRGHIDTVFYAGPNFSAGKLKTQSGLEIKFAGKLFAEENVPIVLNGKWTTHPKYGRQLNVTSIEYDLKLDPEGLAHYLANHPDIKGIGPVKAKMIANTFGKDFETVVMEFPEKIAHAAKVSMTTVTNLRSIWLKTKGLNASLTYLAAFGLTHHQIMTITKKLGQNAVSILKNDPYIIVREIPGMGFKRVDQIFLKIGVSKEHPERIRAGILYCVNEALNNGDCWVEQMDLVDRANTLLVMDCLDSHERIEAELDYLINSEKLVSPAFDQRFLVAKPDIHHMETGLASIFKNGSKPNAHFIKQDDLDRLVNRTAPELNEGQKHAVINALKYQISLISGGAGSGKSFTAASITKIYNKAHLTVVLAAPTGKAAKRLEQLIDQQAYTIHRLLGFNGKNYSRGPDDPIDADLVIVDESSMADVPLAWRLLKAIDFDITAVVFIGDHNQLPPIGPGNILRDLINSRAIPTTVLDKVVRQAGVLKENCRAILKGEVHKTCDPDETGKRSWYLVNQHSDQIDAQKFILHLYQNVLSEKLSFDLIQDVQLLTPTHKGHLGTMALNIELQRLIQKKLWNVQVPDTPPGRRPKFLLHDKVIQTRNNYQIDVMNGSIGTITDIQKNGAMTITFENRPVEIGAGSENLRDIQLAYILSIHRCQGSEFPCAIVIMHKSHSFMHHRNLFYTGVTRAKKTVIIVGDHWGIRTCAQKQQVENRSTFLSFLLVQP